MKIRKPDDEKFFKDIILNDILEEISNENKDISHTRSIKKRPSSKNIFSSKNLLNISIGIFSLLLIVLLFNLATETEPVEKTTQKKSVFDKQEWEMEKEREEYKEELPFEVVEKKVIQKKEVKSKPIKIKSIPIQKTERELAKEALRQQMLN